MNSHFERGNWFDRGNSKVEEAHASALSFSEGRGKDAYVAEFFQRLLIKSETSRFAEGEEVYFTSDSPSLNAAENEVMRAAIGENFNVSDALMRITAVSQSRQNDGTLRYSYQLEGVYETFTLTGVRESDLKPSAEARVVRDIKKRKKQWVAPPSASDAVLYRVIIDQLAAMQAYLYLVQEEVLGVPYLSESLTPIKNTRHIALTQFPNLRPPTTGTSNNDNPTLYFSKRREKVKLKPKDSLLFKFIAMRNTYAQMALAAQRSSPSVFDKKIFDDFYKDDLRLKEITWLAYALSEEGKVLLEKPRQEDPMAVLMYRRPGADTGVTATAPADLRTAFYRIDAPMIKEVYSEYITVFNDQTLSMAYMVESASAEPKAGKIAKAIWAQIKRKTGDLFSAGVVPHRFFERSFQM